MCSAYMVFYVNKLSLDAVPFPHCTLTLSRDEMKSVVALWFENEKLAFAVLETQHTRTCWSTSLLSHDIVCAFIQRICMYPNALKIQAFSSHFSKSIEDGRPTSKYCYALNADILLNDLLIIPIHHEGTIGH